MIGAVKEYLGYHRTHLPYYVVIFLSLVFFILAVNVFVEVSELLINNEIHRFDQRVTEWVLAHRTTALTEVVVIVTHLGDRLFYLFVIGVLVIMQFFRSRWKLLFQISMVLVLAALANIFLKRIFERPRPSLEHLVSVASLSYPSGHAMAAVAFYGFLFYLTLRRIRRWWLKTLLGSLLVLLILGIGYSRVYLGVHFPSDVLAGFMGGLIWLALCVIVYNIIDLRRSMKPDA